MTEELHSRVMVVGGGIGGLTAAVEIAEMGYEVILVEKAPSLGGRVARMAKYFPKMCPPYCGLEINYQRVRKNKNIRVLTLAEVESISGEPRNLDVKVKVNPRYVTPHGSNYDKAIEACEVEVDDDFNLGMMKAKAIRYWHDLAYPHLPYVVESAKDEANVKEAVEKADEAFDLSQTPEELDFKVGAIVWASGWKPFDPTPVTYLGYGEVPGVIQNVEMERICSVNGPTEGKLLRPHDGKEVNKIAFLQCSGSRDANYLGYCSGVCCLASMKQALMARELNPECEVYLFYIDLRSGRYLDFLQKVQEDEKIHLIKGKAGAVVANPETGGVIVSAEDVASGKMEKVEVDMAVLATGLVPTTKEDKIPFDKIQYDNYGFVVSDPNETGVFAVGCLRKPVDVSATIQEATGVSIKAIQTILGG